MLVSAIRWSIRHPWLVILGAIAFAVFGGVYAAGSKLDIFPPIAPAETTIQTEAPGLVAEQVDRLVSQPLENVLLGSTGVDAVRAESIPGLSVIRVQFSPRADPLQVQQLAATRVASAVRDLPAGVQAPRIDPLTSATGEILKLGFTSGRLTPMQLRTFVQWVVRPRLLSTPGVARVTVYGGEIRRIEVRARPGDLSDSDLGLLDVVRAVQRATSVTGAGFIDTPNQRVQIEPRGQALTADDVAKGQIQSPGNAPVRIGDVADVSDAAAPPTGDGLVMGRPGVVVGVQAQYGANTVEETRAVERVLTELGPGLKAQGVAVTTGIERPAGVITGAVHDVLVDLAAGAVLALLLFLLALHDVRAALVSFVCIPLALLAAVAALRALGMSLDTMTLGGLVLGLGVVIDDALIDVENLMNRLRQAEERHASHAEAVLRAALEVRAPVVWGSVVIAIALTPLLALPGATGDLARPLALAAILTVIASMLTAVLVAPALALVVLRHVGPGPHPPIARRLRSANARWLHRQGERPAPVLGPTLALLVLAAGAAVLLLRAGGLPQLHGGHVEVETTAPAATSLEAMRDYGRRLTADFLSIPGVQTVSNEIGRDATDIRAWGTERSRFDLGLKPGTAVAAQEQIADRVRRRLAAYPGLEGSAGASLTPVPPSGEGAARFSVAVVGQDLDALDETAARVARVLRTVTGAGEVRVPARSAAPAVRVDVKFPNLAIYGLSSADVLETLQTAFEGQTAARVYDQGHAVDLAVVAETDLRRDPEAVGDLLLRSTAGVSVPLSKVANVYLSDARTDIVREGGLARLTVEASPSARKAQAFASAARAAIAARVVLPPGVYLQYAGAGASPNGRRALLFDAALAGLGVLAVMAAAFRNGRSAALALSAAPAALAGGVAAALLLGGGVLSLGVVVGFIALIGISIRGAILLIARVEDLVVRRGRPWSLHTAVQASEERLIPILLAALSIGLGLGPMVLWSGQPGSEILRPMAAVILGGLVTGSAFSVLVLPILVRRFWRPARPPPAAGLP